MTEPLTDEQRVDALTNMFLAKVRLQQAFGTHTIPNSMNILEAVEYVIEHLEELAKPQFFGNID